MVLLLLFVVVTVLCIVLCALSVVGEFHVKIASNQPPASVDCVTLIQSATHAAVA